MGRLVEIHVQDLDLVVKHLAAVVDFGRALLNLRSMGLHLLHGLPDFLDDNGDRAGAAAHRFRALRSR